MKKILFIILLMLTFEIIYSQNTGKITIVVFDLDVGGGISKDDAMAFSDMLRSELINKVNFDVVSRDKVNKLMEELKFQSSGLASQDQALEFGKAANAKRAVSGRISYVSLTKKYSITVDLFDFETLTFIVSTNASITPEQIESTIRNIADFISKRAIQKETKVTIEEIEYLVNSLNYEEAKSKLEIYLSQSGASSKTKELESKINRAYSEIKYKQAKEYLKNNLLVEARDAISNAVVMAPDNKEYINLQIEINKRLSEIETKRFQEESKKLSEIQKQIDNVQIKYNNAIIDEKVREYAFDDVKVAQDKIKEARDFLLAKDATSASIKVKEAEAIINQAYKDADIRKQAKEKEKWNNYWSNRYWYMRHGGFDFIFNYYLPQNPYMIANYGPQYGIAINFHIPLGRLFTLYNKIGYIGIINNYNKNPVSGIQDAWVSFLPYEMGVKFHFLLLTIFDLYIQGGWNYTTLWNTATDGVETETLTFTSFGWQFGGGLKIMFTTDFGIFAELMYQGNTFGNVNPVSLDSININSGVFLGL